MMSLSGGWGGAWGGAWGLQSHFVVTPNLVLRLGWGFDNFSKKCQCVGGGVLQSNFCVRLRLRYVRLSWSYLPLGLHQKLWW